MPLDPKPTGLPPSKEAPLYFVRIPEGQIFGPVPLPQLDQWVTEGRIDQNCELRPATSNSWEKSTDHYPILGLPEQVGAGKPFHKALTQDAVSAYLLPNRAIPTLFLALIGLIGVCPIFSIAAWSMAHADLEEIANERMQSQGLPMLRWAHLLGIIGSVGYGLLYIALLMVSMLKALI
ncbi:hypothetical protein GCM10023155_49210 [Bremerella cremea]